MAEMFGARSETLTRMNAARTDLIVTEAPEQLVA